VPLGDFFSSEDGECLDDMNAAVWQMYLNVAMKETAEDAADSAAGGKRRRSGRKPRQPAAGGISSALESASEKFVDRVIMRGVNR